MSSEAQSPELRFNITSLPRVRGSVRSKVSRSIVYGVKGRGEYNVLLADKGIGIVFLFSANFGNVLGGMKFLRFQIIFTPG